MKIAFVHDWFVSYAGSERVFEQMLICYPNADIFSLVDFLQEEERGFLQGRVVQTSLVQDLPLARRMYRSYLPVMPYAIEQFDLSSYDVVISSSHAVAKGVLTGPNQLHLCMCYSPIRYAWDLQHQYLNESGLSRGIKSWIARWMLHRMRIWDARTANGVDKFIAISNFIARRIWKLYRRESVVIYPPVDVAKFSLKTDKQDFYLTASRLVPYKRVMAIVQAFSEMPDKQLIVIGGGPELGKIKQAAAPNVKVMGQQPFQVLREYMQNAKAFVFAAEEDFGIAPLEAQACGTPVIAYGKGGARETICGLDAERPTGLFFDEQTPKNISDAVRIFESEQRDISPGACRANAERFGVERFRREFRAFTDREISAHFML